MRRAQERRKRRSPVSRVRLRDGCVSSHVANWPLRAQALVSQTSTVKPSLFRSVSVFLLTTLFERIVHSHTPCGALSKKALSRAHSTAHTGTPYPHPKPPTGLHTLSSFLYARLSAEDLPTPPLSLLHLSHHTCMPVCVCV